MDCTIDDLPEKFREVAEIIGLAAALILVQRWGGGTVYVPLPQNVARHDLAALLPDGCAMRLAQQFGGGELAVPKATTLRRAQRNREILQARAAGVTVAVIARQHELTERGVWKVLRSP